MERELELRKIERPLVATGRTIGTGSLQLDSLLASVGDRDTTVFPDVRPGSPLETVVAAVDVAQEGGCDGVIALGGGSAVVTARAVCMPPSATDGRDVELSTLGLPYLVVATTPTTAMARLGAAVEMPDGHRLELFHPQAHPGAVLLDKNLLAATATDVFLDAAFATFSNAAELLTTPQLPPLARADLYESVDLACWALAGSRTDGKVTNERRMALTVAAFLCGRAADCGLGRQATIGMAVGHGLQRQMVGMSHGRAMVAALLVGLRLNEEHTEVGQERLLEVMRSHVDAPDLPSALRVLLGSFDVAMSPGEAGVGEAQLRGLAPELLESTFVRSNVRGFATVEEMEAALASAT